MSTHHYEAPFIFEWTGREATALQAALRMTNEGYAEHLGVATRTVAGWRARPAVVPRRDVQEILDTAYRLAVRDVHVVHRFLYALKNGPGAPPRERPGVTSPVVMAAEMELMKARIAELTAELDKEKQS
ncbi:hypothetical protein AB0L04_00005 [Streptomyces glaucescens]|uniref:hypothetical protein n=1 Tax=Streptomyces glaucescens TaxID=1907 RepID=UPI00344E0A7B